MISSKERENLSKDTIINISNIQRDYLLGWLLFSIFTQSKYKNALFLKVKKFDKNVKIQTWKH